MVNPSPEKPIDLQPLRGYPDALNRQEGYQRMSESLGRQAPVASAQRVDPMSGIREEVEFLGLGPLRMFGFLHLPSGQPDAGVVICSPFQAELLKTYRREVLLARELAGRGFAVQRFHYRGSANSDGDAADCTFDTMVEDTELAVDRLVERTGVSRVALVGTRWGGLVAAAVAGRRPESSPLALWEPVVDPAHYFREVFRGRLVMSLKGDSGDRTSDPLDELARNGSIDILGYTITAQLHDSAMGHSLVDELGNRPRAILLVGYGRGGTLTAEYSALRDHWTERGFSVESHVVPSREAWWFGRAPTGRRDDLVRDKTFVGLVGDWLVGLLTRNEEAS
jgi:alpha/beta superfamily hydrolase